MIFNGYSRNDDFIELNSKIITTDSGTCIKHANGFMEQFIKAKVLTQKLSAWGSCYYASVPAVDYIEPFKTVIDSDVRIEADGQAWTMSDNGTLKQSPSVYAIARFTWRTAFWLQCAYMLKAHGNSL